jgi:hypothetical protein
MATMLDRSKDNPRKLKTPLATVLSATALAAACHLWAGWQDEGRLVLQPVGHLVVFALLGWSVAAAVAIVALLLEPRSRRISGASLVLALAGLALLFIRF